MWVLNILNYNILYFSCCNTCDDVERAYKIKNWDFHPSEIEQCKNRSSSEINEKAFKEGCQIFGTLQVNRVSILYLYLTIMNSR